ncbi:hypothetical protein ACIQRW_27370 [Streptomyces sp. NPDC091287]|uniref:hypothetical protein n=1 Tax=Streptomyces sp. NPDC091287 TaxID=3365988 RepID=UPI00381ED348
MLVTATPSAIPAVLAAPFDAGAASSHGVILCTGEGPVQRMMGLVEKPDRNETIRLEAEYGNANLRLLQGRMRVTPRLLHYLVAAARRAADEPKFSLALASYARPHRLDVVTSTQPLTDLGLPSAGGGERKTSCFADPMLH